MLFVNQVWFVGDRTKRPAPINRPVVYALMLAGIFLIVVGDLAATSRLSPTVFTFHIAASAAAFVAYARRPKVLSVNNGSGVKFDSDQQRTNSLLD